MKYDGRYPPISTVAFVILGVLPLACIACLPLLGFTFPMILHWILIIVALLWFLLLFGLIASRQTHRLQVLLSLLQALREGDYSLRARPGRGFFKNIWQEFNALATKLGGEQRLGIETDALLSQLLAALDFAVLVFDQQNRLVDLNPAAEELLGDVSTALIGRTAADLQLSDWQDRVSPFIDDQQFASGGGPWEVRRLTFRRRGQPHKLLVVTDVSHALREEERRAWRRLIRVLGHEINNSLGPIQSTANLLKEQQIIAKGSHSDGDALCEGLELIERRSQALGAFIRRYAELARLPPPIPEPIDIETLIKHVVSLDTRMTIQICSDQHVIAQADRAQLEQALINLVRNAVDAALETTGSVRVGWRTDERNIVIDIEDDGPGIAHDENLFVPFFTTKPGGSGIGLVLARQIIEAHGGTLQLRNRKESRGTMASIRLPVRSNNHLSAQ